MKLNEPTLITITAPTCSGKTYLVSRLIERGFARIVSTTTRPPRAGEVQGIDYDFISYERSRYLEEHEFFAELVEFHGVRYGVTHLEMDKKMAGDAPPIVVLEPHGLALYEKYCAAHDWRIFKIYIQLDPAKLIERLNERTCIEIGALLPKLVMHHEAFVDEATRRLVRMHTDRLLSITGPEHDWYAQNTWDVIVPGDDVQAAIAMILKGLEPPRGGGLGDWSF